MKNTLTTIGTTVVVIAIIGLLTSAAWAQSKRSPDS